MTRRVLFIAPSAGVLGGVADWLEYLKPGLESRGWECVLGLVDGRFHRADPYLERHPWHRVERIVAPTGSREGRLQALEAVIEGTRPDIVAVVNIVDAYGALRRLRLAGRSRARVAMTMHGLESALLDDVRANNDLLDAVVVTNRLSGILAEPAIGDPGRVLYAQYGVPGPAGDGPARGPDRGELAILYSGRVEDKQKRILDLPAILKGLHDRGLRARIDIAGGGPSHSALVSACEAAGVSEQVRFLGVLGPEQLAAAYRSHDALLVTSSWETGPIVAWEAMAAGLPFVSSRYVGSGREGALRDGDNCLLFPVGDTAAAVEALAGLHGNEELAHRLASAGRALVATRYSRDASVAAWDQALGLVLALPEREPPRAHGGKRRPPSRLERLVGAGSAERLRRLLRISYRHTNKGGEWPHAGHRQRPSEPWLQALASVDGGKSPREAGV